MSNIDKEINERIQTFVAELSALVREAAVHAVSEALSNGARPAAAPRARAKRAAGGRRAARAPGAKRSPAELDALVDMLRQYVSDNPGQRIEEIATALQVSTKELALPAKKLLADKKVKTTGQRRATRYFPAGRGSGAPKTAATTSKGKGKTKAKPARKRKAKGRKRATAAKRASSAKSAATS